MMGLARITRSELTSRSGERSPRSGRAGRGAILGAAISGGLLIAAASPAAWAGPTIDLLGDPDSLADHFVFACDAAADPQTCLVNQFEAATRIQTMNARLADRAATPEGEAAIEACGTAAGLPDQVDLVVLADCLSRN